MLRAGLAFNHAEIIGGGEISFIDLADALRTQAVHPVAIVPGPGEVMDRLHALGIETVESAWPPLRIHSLARYPGLVRSMARRFRELQLDLVHANGARCMLYCGPAARRAGIPCLWHVRVLDRDPMLDRVRARYASLIVANSRAVAATLRGYSPAGRPVEVIYNGFPLAAIRDCAAIDLRAAFGLPAGPILLAVGRLCPWKGFDDLLEAGAILQRQSVAFTCLIAGASVPADSDYERRLKRKTVQSGLTQIRFLGQRQDIWGLMKGATALVMPSHGEPFGRVIVEAWACGLPVIATNSGGPAELIKDGLDGILYPTGDVKALAISIQSLWNTPARALQLRTAGVRKAEQFSLAGHAESVAHCYQRLLLLHP